MHVILVMRGEVDFISYFSTVERRVILKQNTNTIIKSEDKMYDSSLFYLQSNITC